MPGGRCLARGRCLTSARSTLLPLHATRLHVLCCMQSRTAISDWTGDAARIGAPLYAACVVACCVAYVTSDWISLPRASSSRASPAPSTLARGPVGLSGARDRSTCADPSMPRIRRPHGVAGACVCVL
jgi:hypothetical protein